jgi:predicted nucleotidyltransferase
VRKGKGVHNKVRQKPVATHWKSAFRNRRNGTRSVKGTGVVQIATQFASQLDSDLEGGSIDRELRLLAEIIDRWVQPVPGVREVYLFGSRVRGDHRPNSDIDLRIFVEELTPDAQTMEWWTHQNVTDFAELKSQLPGPLAIHRDSPEIVDEQIRAERASPKLKIGKVVCVRTPPKT